MRAFAASRNAHRDVVLFKLRGENFGLGAEVLLDHGEC